MFIHAAIKNLPIQLKKYMICRHTVVQTLFFVPLFAEDTASELTCKFLRLVQLRSLKFDYFIFYYICSSINSSLMSYCII